MKCLDNAVHVNGDLNVDLMLRGDKIDLKNDRLVRCIDFET